MADRSDDGTRYFIVSPGRTGSTMLAWVMAKAGADFALPVPERWDPKAGEMEHPRLIAGAKRLGASHQIAGDKPRQLIRRTLWTWHRHAGRQQLRRVLAQASFLKSEDLDLAVQSAAKLGYRPKIVLSYRRFDQQAASRMQRQNYASVDWLQDYYLRVCRNALVQIKLYGGCLIGYDDLMDPENTDWSGALEAVTGLSPEKLVLSRNEVLAEQAPQSSAGLEQVHISFETHALFEEMQMLRNQSFGYSRQAERNL